MAMKRIKRHIDSVVISCILFTCLFIISRTKKLKHSKLCLININDVVDDQQGPEELTATLI